MRYRPGPVNASRAATRSPAGALATAGLLAVVVGACTTGPPPLPPVDDTRAVDADRAAVLGGAGEFLQRRGIEPVTTDRAAGTLSAGPSSLTNDAWVRCPDVRVRDSDGERRRDADRVAQAVEVLVETERQGGRTLVTVSPRFTQTLRNSFTNQTFERPCPSSGRLERALLDAL